jgi:hypothetical protein
MSTSILLFPRPDGTKQSRVFMNACHIKHMFLSFGFPNFTLSLPVMMSVITFEVVYRYALLAGV